MPDIVMLDCETLGLDPEAPVWEVAMIRMVLTDAGDVYSGMPPQRSWSFLVEHNEDGWSKNLPQSFQDDYQARYVNNTGLMTVLEQPDVAAAVYDFTKGCIIAGSNPDFDMRRLGDMIRHQLEIEPAWHYHAIDVPTAVHGFLLGKGISPAQPWKSDFLSRIIGVDPERFGRHTALGDARCCAAMWEKINGG